MRMRKRRMKRLKVAGIFLLIMLMTFGSVMTAFADVEPIDELMEVGETEAEPPAETEDMEAVVEEGEADLEEPAAELEEPEGDTEETEGELLDPEDPSLLEPAKTSVDTMSHHVGFIEWDGNKGKDSLNCNLNGEGPRDAKEGWIHWVVSTKGDSTNAKLTLGGTGSGMYDPGQPLNANTWHFYTPYFELDGLTAEVTFEGELGPGNGIKISDYCPGEPDEMITEIAIKKQTFIGDTSRPVRDRVTFSFILKPVKGGEVIRIDNVPANGMSEFIQIEPGKYFFKEVEKDGYVMDEWKLVTLEETEGLSIMGAGHRWSGGWSDHRDRNWWDGRRDRKPGDKHEHIIEILPDTKSRIDVINRKVVEKELSKLSVKKIVVDGNDILDVEETFKVKLERLNKEDEVEFYIDNGEIVTGNLEPGFYRLSEIEVPDGYRWKEYRLTNPYGPDPWSELDDGAIVFRIPDKKIVHYKLLIINEKIPEVRKDMLGIYKVVENVENDSTLFTIEWKEADGEDGIIEVRETAHFGPEPIAPGLYRFRERAQTGYDPVRVELWKVINDTPIRVDEPTFVDGWLELDLTETKCIEYRIVFVNRVRPDAPPPPPPPPGNGNGNGEPRPPRPRNGNGNGNGVLPVSVQPPPVPTAPPVPVIPVLEEPIPLAPPVLPTTGEGSPFLFYMVGMLLAGAGFLTRKYSYD